MRLWLKLVDDDKLPDENEGVSLAAEVEFDKAR